MISLHDKKVNVNKIKLIEILKTNRDTHRKEYEEALANFKKAYLLELQEALKVVSAEGVVSDHFYFETKPPISAIDSYDEIIEMLEMSVDENVSLDSASFQCYVKDQWGWKSIMSNSILSNNMVSQKYSAV